MKTLSILYSLIIGLLSLSPAMADAPALSFFDPYPKIDTKTWYLSDGWANGEHQACEWSAKAISVADDKSLELRLSDTPGKTRAYTCAEIRTQSTFGYGRFETRMKTTIGSGLNTAFFTYTGPPYGAKEHDEIDFEFLGKEKDALQLSYWHDAKNYDVKIINLGFDPSADYHDYMFEWTPDHIIWFVDGKEVYKTSGQHPMPRNPQNIFFSLWSGTKSMDDWLGKFTYTQPKTAYVQWVRYTPYVPDTAKQK